ncbi:hypothetical protein PVAND_012245 [Polypedilum vanderplanki]|uniref:Uncharacterized protein n=1 Tax=Polypedilum vanderplanki TaxID=319348 RepID=A0A9J6CM53_POLVA|nr:hypothetical protein PVAND_012245 [Polypedilum vanderplanki]
MIETELNELNVKNDRKNSVWFSYNLKWLIVVIGNIIINYQTDPYLMLFKSYQNIGYYVSLELFSILAFIFYEKIDKIQNEIGNISNRSINKRSIKKLDDLIEFTDKFNDYVRSVNHAVGAQVFVTVMQMVISLIILIFTLSFKIGGNLLDMKSLIFFLFCIFFVHLNLIQICGTSDLVERKVKDIHTSVRKAYNHHYTKLNEAFLDININIEKFNCGLINFDWTLLTMVKNKVLKEMCMVFKQLYFLTFYRFYPLN